MHTQDLSNWQHDHVFGQDRALHAERRTLMVVVVTAAMMVVEVVAGVAYSSMALLADGLHMASHTAALGIAVMAYVVARRLAADRRFSFGTGKVNSLAGFASAVLLAGFALLMATESVKRLIDPVAIAFDQALVVAGIGLVVNGASAWLLATTPHSHGQHDHGHDDHGHHDHDHNLRAAYLHVLADALTSVLAIVALLAAKLAGAGWLDPAMGIVGAALVARWSVGLMRASAQVLLDRQAEPKVTEALRSALQADGRDRVADLHVWSIGQGIRAAAVAVVSDAPKSPSHYKALIPGHLGIVHTTIEIHQCPRHLAARGSSSRRS